MSEPRYSPEKEYEVLTNELIQGKSYVFERPILIITASLALFQFIEEQYAIYFPIVIIGLLFFNLWFTVNRLESMARIIAYIQLIHEDNETKWFGWETSLRYYRKYLRIKRLKINKIKIEDSMIYDNIGFYPPIYWMHVILTISIFLALAIFTISNAECNNMIMSLLTFVTLIRFLIYAVVKRPPNIKPNIERNRKIWVNVFAVWDNLKKSN